MLSLAPQAQGHTDAQIDDTKVRRLIRESVLPTGATPQRPFDLTFDDAIQRSFKRNLDVAQEAFYRLTLSFNYDSTSAPSPRGRSSMAVW